MYVCLHCLCVYVYVCMCIYRNAYMYVCASELHVASCMLCASAAVCLCICMYALLLRDAIKKLLAQHLHFKELPVNMVG
jgi:hypothetical protein